jgi:hypothetical protein
MIKFLEGTILDPARNIKKEKDSSSDIEVISVTKREDKKKPIRSDLVLLSSSPVQVSHIDKKTKVRKKTISSSPTAIERPTLPYNRNQTLDADFLEIPQSSRNSFHVDNNLSFSDEDLSFLNRKPSKPLRHVEIVPEKKTVKELQKLEKQQEKERIKMEKQLKKAFF